MRFYVNGIGLESYTQYERPEGMSDKEYEIHLLECRMARQE